MDTPRDLTASGTGHPEGRLREIFGNRADLRGFDACFDFTFPGVSRQLGRAPLALALAPNATIRNSARDD